MLVKQLSKNEEYIIQAIRSLEPFECIQVTADASGKPDRFLIRRSVQTILTIERDPINVRTSID